MKVHSLGMVNRALPPTAAAWPQACGDSVRSPRYSRTSRGDDPAARSVFQVADRTADVFLPSMAAAFVPPPMGHWVIMQPWEFGGLPSSWIGLMRHGG